MRAFERREAKIVSGEGPQQRIQAKPSGFAWAWCHSISAAVLAMLCLSACTETMLPRRPAPHSGSLQESAEQKVLEQVARLEETSERNSSRMEQLFRLTSARLSMLEALSAYQSMGLKILARGESQDRAEERRLFSELSRLGDISRRTNQDAKREMEAVLMEIPPESVLAEEVRGWLENLNASNSFSSGAPSSGGRVPSGR